MGKKLKKYEKAILEILGEYATIKYQNVEGRNQLIIDKENHRYQVVTIGWQGEQFVHDCPIHFDIINDKVWVQQNNTDWEVGDMLEERGIPKSDIVVGFLPPNLRAYTKYAVA
ncbi:MAG: XisI protein [Saprospiraceae bacterium]|nr:XisI protein [Saprospiraceae bacterium]